MRGICEESVTEVMAGRRKMATREWKPPLGFAFAGQPKRLSLRELLRFPFDDAATPLK
jgi:hypothetical protein